MKNRFYLFFCITSFLLSSFVLVFHFHIFWLPAACFVTGILVRIIFKSSYLAIFSFLIPVLPAFAALENKGFPLNYLLLPAFFLCGIMAGEFAVGKGKVFPALPELPRYYISFLLLLGVSFIFVMLRWSNITLSHLAFFKDTPIAPSGQRLSFGIIFPVVELALFVLLPLYFLLLKRSVDLRRILISFLCGHSLSILYSLIQRFRGPRLSGFLIPGLATDATVFGFLSSLVLLLAWYLYFHYAEKWLGLFFIFISLIGILNSTTRIGFFAIIVTLFLFVFYSRKKILSLLLLVILLAGSLMIYIQWFYQPEMNFINRFINDFNSIKKSMQLKKMEEFPLVDESDPRNILWHYSIESLRNFPITGVGTGNFVFWVMSAHKKSYLHHLPSNQYFFIASSTGLIGLSVFLFFYFGIMRFKKWPEKILLAVFLFLLIFNDYLWFPEIFLVFWLFASLGENSEERPAGMSGRAKILYFCGFSVFIIFNIMNFSSLHPATWAKEKETPYDYGFSYPESEGGRSFRWSGEKAGVYVFLEKDHPRATYKLACGAPLSNFPGKTQSVEVFWRGRPFRRIVFRKHGEYLLQLEDDKHLQGFLEFRVRPAFNLKQMGLGAESRDLGVKLFSKTVAFAVDVSEKRTEGGRDYHFLRGWIFINDEETEGQEVYVVFTKPDGAIMRYSAMPEKRADIAAYFKNIRYDASGFSALIPLENDLDIHSCTIRFEVKNKFGIYKSAVWKTPSK